MSAAGVVARWAPGGREQGIRPDPGRRIALRGPGGDYAGRVSSRRAERLVNLVLCLLSTRQFLTAERIRTAVPGYEPDDGTARADEIDQSLGPARRHPSSVVATGPA